MSDELRELVNGINPRYEAAARVTAEIMNLYLFSDLPKHEVFRNILLLIINATQQAQIGIVEGKYDPSTN